MGHGFAGHYRILVYGSDSLNTSSRAEANVTYATVQPTDDTIGNETYGVFFGGGAGNGAYLYDFNTGSKLQIGAIIPQAGSDGNYSMSFTWSYRNMTTVRDYNFTFGIPKSALGSATSLEATEAPGSEMPPCSPLLDKLTAACKSLSTTKEQLHLDQLFATLDNLGVVGVAVTGEAIEIPGYDAVSTLFTVLDIACIPVEIAGCEEKEPGCTVACQDAPMERMIYSEVVCINKCYDIYPDPCCPVLPLLAREFCSALSPQACNIGCGVCGLNGFP